MEAAKTREWLVKRDETMREDEFLDECDGILL